jgi:hypothetical protein
MNTQKMQRGLYVDDIRNIPASYQNDNEVWDLARNYDQAIKMLQITDYDMLSLDHDIASWNDDGREMTGYDITLWLAQRKIDGLYTPPEIFVHSANPVGVRNMNAVLDRYVLEK